MGRTGAGAGPTPDGGGAGPVTGWTGEKPVSGTLASGAAPPPPQAAKRFKGAMLNSPTRTTERRLALNSPLSGAGDGSFTDAPADAKSADNGPTSTPGKAPPW